MKSTEDRGFTKHATHLSRRHPALRPDLAAACRQADGRDRANREIVAGVLASRDGRHTTSDDQHWRLLVDYLASRGARTDPGRNAAYATAVALLTWAEECDYCRLETLVELTGLSTTARYFDEIDRDLGEPAPSATTALIRRLASPDDYRAFAGAAPDTARIQRLRHLSRSVGTALLLIGIDAEAPGPTDPILTVPGFERIVKHGDVRVWRSHLAPIAADPWGEHAHHLWKIIRQTDLSGPAAIIALAIRHFRERAEAAERRWVAEQVAALIASTGLSQQDFAARVGTSPSRVSTYVHGHVTPSASMMYRMARVAQDLANDGPAVVAAPFVLNGEPA